MYSCQSHHIYMAAYLIPMKFFQNPSTTPSPHLLPIHLRSSGELLTKRCELVKLISYTIGIQG